MTTTTATPTAVDKIERVRDHVAAHARWPGDLTEQDIDVILTLESEDTLARTYEPLP